MSEIIGKNRKVGRISKSPTYSSKELEAALKLVNSLGFKVTPPSSKEDIAKLEASKKKLGFSDAVKKVTEVSYKPQAFRLILGTAHRIGGETYGPGEVTIPIEQDALFRTLMHQESLTAANYRDTSDYQPRSKCFMVGQKGLKVEVSEAAFNSDQLPFEPAIMVGSLDIAGYNPNIQSVNRVF